MGLVASPRKAFQFVVEIDGVNQFEIQKFTPAKVTIAKTEHGETNHKIKTAGMVEVGDVTMEKLRPLPTTDLWAWNLLRAAQDMETGGGGLEPAYKKVLIVKEMSADRTTTVNRWVYTGAWVFDVSQSDFDRMSSDNIIETVIWSVDKPQRV
jgi:phage tail-like protein